MNESPWQGPPVVTRIASALELLALCAAKDSLVSANAEGAFIDDLNGEIQRRAEQEVRTPTAA
jgi:hypothetical protein